MRQVGQRDAQDATRGVTRTRLSSRRGTSASSSSKKMIQGLLALALANTCLTARSLSPTYWREFETFKHSPKYATGTRRRTLFSSSGPFTLMKFALDSFATAFASNVLPHPGGPHSSTPHAATIPTALNSSGRRIGCTIAMCSSSRVACSAPKSAHVTSGTVAKPSRLDEGCTCCSASMKSA